MRLLKIEKNLKNAIELTFTKLNIRNVIIHRMNISKDLKYIRIFVSSLSNEVNLSENLKLTRNLNKKAFLIKKELNNHISFKYQPELSFEFDQHTMRIDKINKIFEEIKEESIEEVSEDNFKENFEDTSEEIK